MKCTAEEFETMSKDSAYHDIGTLPSNGIPYGQEGEFKLLVRTFRLPELRLLSKAVDLGEMEHLLRAVDNTISFPVEELTIGDFFYVLLWLRLYSMPKAPYIVEWRCEQPFFTHKQTRKQLMYTDAVWPTVEELKTDYEVEPCGTENTGVIHQSDIEILSIDDGTVLPEGFDWPRVSCYNGRAEAMKNPELKLLAPAIQWFSGKTWEEKMLNAELHTDLVGEALDLNRKQVHGIAETVKFSCRRCRIEHSTVLELNALSFFR